MYADAATRCTDCEAIALATVQDRRPSQLLPIPRLAMAGFADGRDPRALTRRRLMQFGAAGVASVYAPRLLGWQSVWESVVAEASPMPNALVVLYLAGGQDGMNVIVPNSSTDFPLYAQMRPLIGRIQGPSSGGLVGSLPVPTAGGELAFAAPTVSTPGGGDNGDPAFGFDTLYGAGDGGAGSNLALMPATDYMPPNLSHFTSQDYWFSGALESLSTGWLGRWLDLYGSSTNPLQGISIGYSLSKSLLSAQAPVCTISSLSNNGFAFNAGGGAQGGSNSAINPNAVLAQLAALPAGNPSLAAARSAYGLAVGVEQSVSPLSGAAMGTGYPANSYLAYQLQLAAVLLSAGFGTRVITINWGGFDTHGDQIATQDPQLIELSRCLGAFQADLETRGIDGQVATLMFSEFGRRAQDNASGGTDHGAGGLMMALGTNVRGGYAAPFPGLGSLDSSGSVLVPTDFRSVYQEAIASWLGGDPTAVLPGGPFPGISRYDSGTGLFDDPSGLFT
ncbi:MAG: DUF1501 domain-containing protein [Solirubrobacteraceae bacterium]